MINWTQEKRKFMFETLLERAGPFSTWENGRPTKISREQYATLLGLLSNLFGGTGNEDLYGDVAMQIRFGCPDWSSTKPKGLKGGHRTALFLNIAAALEVGFVVSTDFPKNIEICFTEAT